VSATPDDDREAIDRAFAELVAGYHLTAPDPLPPVKVDPPPEPARLTDPEPPRLSDLEPPPPTPSSAWADNHPLFVSPEPSSPAPILPEPDPEPDERYVPEPQPPLRRPSLPILLAWAGIAYAAVVVLLAAFGVRLPAWMGWMALGGFIGGFGVLVVHLPRSRPPDAGDGAVL
jgi:hypothetical protein